MTKSNKAKKAYEQMKEYGYQGENLWNVYGVYSHEKERAYDYCIQLMRKFNGFNGGILAHNVSIFTFGFEFVDPETGVVCYAYITPSYDYYCEI